jgi:hypothetical protein
MTQEEFEKATPEEWVAEVERCKDPYYFYHTYWQNADGTPVKQYSREDWDSIMEFVEQQKFNRFKSYRRIQPLCEGLNNEIKWREPDVQMYDGSRLNRIYPLTPDECFPTKPKI